MIQNSEREYDNEILIKRKCIFRLIIRNFGWTGSENVIFFFYSKFGYRTHSYWNHRHSICFCRQQIEVCLCFHLPMHNLNVKTNKIWYKQYSRNHLNWIILIINLRFTFSSELSCEGNLIQGQLLSSDYAMHDIIQVIDNDSWYKNRNIFQSTTESIVCLFYLFFCHSRVFLVFLS